MSTLQFPATLRRSYAGVYAKAGSASIVKF